MLNRMAESFYWIGRYMERMDYTARFVNINYYSQHLLGTETSWDELKNRFSTVLKDVPIENRREIKANSNKLLELIAYDPTYMNSILNCLNKARFNVKIVRQYATNRMWDTLNSFYLWLTGKSGKSSLEQMPFLFFERIRREVFLFQSVADKSMLHEIEWRFLQAGRLIERAGNVVRILQMFLDAIERKHDKELNKDYHRLISLLENADGFEAFRKVHANEVNFEKIMEFLVLHSSFPGSIYFSLTELEEELRGMDDNNIKDIAKLIRKVVRLRTLLYQCLDLSEKPIENYQNFLDNVIAGCNQIGLEIEKIFVFENGEELAGQFPGKLAKLL